ncbi:MAG TPA: MDR family MFS transporter [Aliidongia sp.]|uniref:MDR family MFS transporter n=1 Tax=Aliidongia sp. TaxID=1914230 RepID=UPI002DDCBAA4|nr:MDR family MFS transporter [Aliidongia sp.]HEV2677988.1 MDR family MFS transporter [Aliidongia sp.]
MSAEPAPAPSPTRFTHRETIVIIAGLMLGMFLAALDQTIVATALPRMAADLQGVGHLSWVVSAYLLTATAVTPIYGKLSDLYGRKLMLQIAISLFVLTSLLCGLADTMVQLIVFRALQGLGGGGLLAMAHATIADVISPRERGRYQGYIASVFAAASVVGPVLGGLFVDHLTWRWVFWINLPIGIGALIASQATLKRLAAKRLRHKIDYLGAILIVSAVCCVLLITTMGGEEVPWDSLAIKALAAGAVVLFVGCIFQERHASEPILPPRLFHNRVFVVANAANLLMSICMLGGIVFMPLFLQLVYSMQADASGLMLIPLTAGTVVGAISAGQMVARTGRYKPFPMIGLAVSITGLCLLTTVTSATPLPLAGVYLAVNGLGIGLIMPSLLVAIQNSVDARDIGSGTASITFFRSMGGSFGVALFGAVLLARLNGLILRVPGSAVLGASPGTELMHAGPEAIGSVPADLRPAVATAIAESFHDVFMMSAALSLLALVILFFLKEIPLRTSPGTPGDAAKVVAAALAD